MKSGFVRCSFLELFEADDTKWISEENKYLDG